MKLVLNTGTEFAMASLYMVTENKMCVAFTGITSFDE